MRLPLLLAVPLLLAGCATPSATETSGKSAAACDILYPDNSTFDCAKSFAVTDGIQAKKPGPTDGWSCVGHTEDNKRGRGWVEVLRHQDGRIGYAWSWKAPAEGQTFMAFAAFYGTTGQAFVTPWKPTGFAILPQKPTGDAMEVHTLAVNFLLDVKEGGGEWREAEGAKVVVGAFGGHPWYVFEYTAAGRVQYLDVMQPDKDEGWKREWSPAKGLFEREGHEAFATVTFGGGKFQRIPLNAPDPKTVGGCLTRAVEVG